MVPSSSSDEDISAGPVDSNSPRRRGPRLTRRARAPRATRGRTSSQNNRGTAPTSVATRGTTSSRFRPLTWRGRGSSTIRRHINTRRSGEPVNQFPTTTAYPPPLPVPSDRAAAGRAVAAAHVVQTPTPPENTATITQSTFVQLGRGRRHRWGYRLAGPLNARGGNGANVPIVEIPDSESESRHRKVHPERERLESENRKTKKSKKKKKKRERVLDTTDDDDDDFELTPTCKNKKKRDDKDPDYDPGAGSGTRSAMV